MMRPDDLAKADIGVWPSANDDPVQVTCTGCRRRGPRTMLAREALCWGCWAKRWQRPSTETAGTAVRNPR